MLDYAISIFLIVVGILLIAAVRKVFILTPHGPGRYTFGILSIAAVGAGVGAGAVGISVGKLTALGLLMLITVIMVRMVFEDKALLIWDRLLVAIACGSVGIGAMTAGGGVLLMGSICLFGAAVGGFYLASVHLSKEIAPIVPHAIAAACWGLSHLADFVVLFDINIPVFGLDWWAVSNLLIWGGSISMLAVASLALCGFMQPPDENELMALHRHVGFAWVLYSVSGFMRLGNDMVLLPPSLVPVLVSLAGLICLGIGGWYGGQMVYRYHLGMKGHI